MRHVKSVTSSVAGLSRGRVRFERIVNNPQSKGGE